MKRNYVVSWSEPAVAEYEEVVRAKTEDEAMDCIKNRDGEKWYVRVSGEIVSKKKAATGKDIAK